jgi:hypothetical protein
VASRLLPSSLARPQRRCGSRSCHQRTSQRVSGASRDDAEEHTSVVLVPSEAIVHEGDETAVFVAVGTKGTAASGKAGITNKAQAKPRA